MEIQNNILKELSEISLRISKINKENVFKVPEGYFENLPEQIINKIGEASQQKIELYQNRNQWWLIYAIAAVLAVVFTFSFWKFKVEKENKLYNYYSTEEYILTNCSEAFLMDYVDDKVILNNDNINNNIDINDFETDLLIEEL